MTVRQYEEALEKYGYFASPPKGTSMLPLLREGEDVVEIRPCKTVRVLDVILYRRANGDLVLHRVVGKRRDGYVLRGDNQTVNEYGVKDAQIIGKLTAFHRKGKARDMRSLSLRLYGFVWWAIYPLRYAERAARALVGKLRRKLRSAS